MQCQREGREGNRLQESFSRTDVRDKIIIVKVEYSFCERSGLGAIRAHQLKVERSKPCGQHGQQKSLSEYEARLRFLVVPLRLYEQD